MKNIKIYLWGLISALAWSFSALIVTKIFYLPAINNLQKTSSSFLISAISESFGFIFLLFFTLKKTKKILRCKGKKNISLGALISGPIGISLYYLSINYVGASVSDAITGTYPVIIVLVSYIFFKKRYDYKVYIGILLTFIGVYTLGTYSVKINILGFIIALITALSWSCEALILDFTATKTKIPWISSIFIRQATTSIAYICLFFIFFIMFKQQNSKFNLNEILLNKELILLCLLNGFFIVLSYGSFYYSITLGGATIPAILNSTYIAWTPIITLIFANLGWFSFDILPKITTLFIISLIIIILGITSVLYFSSEKYNKK